DSIQRWLRGSFGSPVRFFDEITSTNDEAMRWATLEAAPQGSIVVTDHQVTGRGRWGRTWFSQPGTAIQFSLILRPSVPVDVLGLLTTALGLACAEGVEIAAGIKCAVKWPNDVVVDGRKLAGILVESRVSGHVMDIAIAGMGINVYPPTGDVPDDIAGRATSVLAEARAAATGKEPSRAEILGWVLDSFGRLYERVGSGEGAAELIERATARSDVIGHDVVIRLADGSTLEGRAERILPSGALEVAEDDRHRAVHVGEVEQVRTA
ncbi:MAG: biotin--[acetyl-CoA-carboxylase] ligase, partial [Actinomycetota bacterium]|nr:biotin--[acetyl-CoA-carboxylase] ligase [Actinomycetota bacterium]